MATSLIVVALLTSQSSAVSLRESALSGTELWAEIEKQAAHKHPTAAPGLPRSVLGDTGAAYESLRLDGLWASEGGGHPSPIRP